MCVCYRQILNKSSGKVILTISYSFHKNRLSGLSQILRCTKSKVSSSGCTFSAAYFDISGFILIAFYSHACHQVTYSGFRTLIQIDIVFFEAVVTARLPTKCWWRKSGNSQIIPGFPADSFRHYLTVDCTMFFVASQR